jgi:hypothetical protein
MAPEHYPNFGIHPNTEELYSIQHNIDAAGILSRQKIPYPHDTLFTTTHHEDLISFLHLIL